LQGRRSTLFNIACGAIGLVAVIGLLMVGNGEQPKTALVWLKVMKWVYGSLVVAIGVALSLRG